MQMANQRIPDRPFILAGQMTTADPSRSPAGTESMWAYTHLPRRETWAGDDIAAYAERIEDIIEEHAPGFREPHQARRSMARTTSPRRTPAWSAGRSAAAPPASTRSCSSAPCRASAAPIP